MNRIGLSRKNGSSRGNEALISTKTRELPNNPALRIGHWGFIGRWSLVIGHSKRLD
jgi:hypothetical protein